MLGSMHALCIHFIVLIMLIFHYQGASIARRFSQNYPVALLARNPKNYEGVVDDIIKGGGEAVGFSADVSDASSINRAFAEIDKAFPGSLLAAAVYNVGGGLSVKPFLELSEDEFTQGFKTNGYLFL